MADTPASAPTTTAEPTMTSGTGPSTNPVTVNQPAPPQQGAPQTVTSTEPEPLAPELITRGGRWKLGEEDLRSVPRDVLERMMAAADAEVMEGMARVRQPNGQAQQTQIPSPYAQQGQQPQYQQPAQPQQAQQPTMAFTPVELKFEDEGEDTPAANYAKTINEGMTKNLNAMHADFAQQISSIVEAVKAIHTFNDLSILDRHIGTLGSEWEDTFGAGATVDLDPRSPSYENRMAYRKAILENLNLDATLGRERNPSEAMLRARYRNYGQKIAQLERAKREAKAKEVAKGLPAPTGAANGRSSVSGGLRESIHRAVQEISAAR
jgi:hypothetical protein